MTNTIIFLCLIGFLCYTLADQQAADPPANAAGSDDQSGGTTNGDQTPAKETTTTTTTTTTEPSSSTIEANITDPLNPTTSATPTSSPKPIFPLLSNEARMVSISTVLNFLHEIRNITQIETALNTHLPTEPLLEDEMQASEDIVFKYINRTSQYALAEILCHREGRQLLGPRSDQTFEQMKAISSEKIWVNMTKQTTTVAQKNIYSYQDGTAVPEVVVEGEHNIFFTFNIDAASTTDKCLVFDFAAAEFSSAKCDDQHKFFCFEQSNYPTQIENYKIAMEQTAYILTQLDSLAEYSHNFEINFNATVNTLENVTCTHQPIRAFDLTDYDVPNLDLLFTHLLLRNDNINEHFEDISSFLATCKSSGSCGRDNDNICYKTKSDTDGYKIMIILTAVAVGATIIMAITSIIGAFHQCCPNILRLPWRQVPTEEPIGMQPRRDSAENLPSILRRSRSPSRVSFSEAYEASAPPPTNPYYHAGGSKKYRETTLFTRSPNQSVSSLSSSSSSDTPEHSE